MYATPPPPMFGGSPGTGNKSPAPDGDPTNVEASDDQKKERVHIIDEFLNNTNFMALPRMGATQVRTWVCC